jgi:hypothetical protein
MTGLLKRRRGPSGAPCGRVDGLSGWPQPSGGFAGITEGLSSSYSIQAGYLPLVDKYYTKYVRKSILLHANLLIIQRNSRANIVNLTVDILARLAVIDPVAVANIKAAAGAIPPDRVLDEPGKHHRERGIGQL